MSTETKKAKVAFASKICVDNLTFVIDDWAKPSFKLQIIMLHPKHGERVVAVVDYPTEEAASKDSLRVTRLVGEKFLAKIGIKHSEVCEMGMDADAERLAREFMEGSKA